VIVIMILGAGTGVGVWLVVRAATRRPLSLAAVFAALDQPGIPHNRIGDTQRPAGLETAAYRLLRSMGFTVTRQGQALRLSDRSEQRHALDRLVGAVGGLLGPNLIGVALVVAGIGIPVGLPVVVSFATMIGGFMLPELTVKDTAEKRRRAFRHALSAYLDLVNVLLAGGAGIETALYAAAEAGDGWGFATIRSALQRARLTGRSPWETFAMLGDELGVSELAELSASVSLAGSHGARIRQSLAAKADTLRGHQIAETESEAEAATERMTIPVAVLLFGFLVFIAYPAVAQITSVTGPTP
jgi:tight adherence protein C